MNGARVRGLLPWALLCIAALAAVMVARRMPAARARLEPGSDPHRLPKPSGTPATGEDEGSRNMTREDLRDFHVRLAHEQCEEGMQRFNTLEGRAPTDPQALTRLSVCLRIGNVAWYKCMLRAAGAGDARLCNRRFLSLDNPP